MNSASGIKFATNMVRTRPLSAALFLIPSLLWIYRDHSLFWFDEAEYAEGTVSLWYELVTNLPHWPTTAIGLFGRKAPGIAWLGEFFVPIGQALHHMDFGLLLSVLAAQTGTLIISHKIGKIYLPANWTDPWIAVLAVAASPLFIGLSHRYFVEPLQTFAITYAYWIALTSSERPASRTLSHLVVAISLAMIAKASSPIYLLLPAAISILASVVQLNRWKGTNGKNGAWPHIFVATLAVVPAAAWYIENWSHMVAHLRFASSGEGANYYGNAGPFLVKFEFWIGAVQRAFFVPEVLIIFISLFAFSLISLVRRIETQRCQILGGGPSLRRLVVAAAALQLLGVLAVFSLNINEESRYLLPLAPAVLVIVSAMAASLNKFARTALLVVLTCQWAYAHAQAHGLLPRDDRLSGWLLPIDVSPDRDAEISRLESATCDRQTTDRVSVIGVDMVWLSHITLSYYSEKARLERGFRCQYAQLGWAEKSVDVAWERLVKLAPLYFVSISDPDKIPADVFNVVALPILDRVRHSDHWRPQNFDSRLAITVFRNVQ